MKANKINKAWHEQHHMPKNANTDERIAWHLEHAKYCNCRPIPEKLQLEIDKRSGNAKGK